MVSCHIGTYPETWSTTVKNIKCHVCDDVETTVLILCFPLPADYCASKFAAVGFAESVGLELLATGKDGVKTTIVCPYFINTGMFDGCQTK